MSKQTLNKNIKRSFFSKRKKEKEKLNFGVASTFVTLMSVIAMLLLYYVWILNANATRGYTIRDLENTKKSLLMEKQVLDVKIAELESLSNILQNDDLQNMEKTENPDYLVIKSDIQYVYNY